MKNLVMKILASRLNEYSSYKLLVLGHRRIMTSAIGYSRGVNISSRPQRDILLRVKYQHVVCRSAVC
jgi:hypothetical protein